MCLEQNTVSHVTRPTLNDLQTNINDKGPLMDVSAHNLSGLALVPYAFSAMGKTGRQQCRITQTLAEKRNQATLP